ncbi:hypothetical protein RCL_jg7702.t1 [Rhizophagus clarus]|uniref:Uncharacterized protein n=1 Tax=Rhizophagus clarus TaxID=94130 RepID=A0A8H3M9R3_9GLOM|nr:hypothetical protein RCL_jg7702.t1 [Rhizophagus clarus]
MFSNVSLLPFFESGALEVGIRNSAFRRFWSSGFRYYSFNELYFRFVIFSFFTQPFFESFLKQISISLDMNFGFLDAKFSKNILLAKCFRLLALDEHELYEFGYYLLNALLFS